MIKIIESKDIISLEQAREECKKNTAIFVITEEITASNLLGYIYAISTEITSLDKLIDLEAELQQQGKQTIIIGSYDSYFSFGLLHEV